MTDEDVDALEINQTSKRLVLLLSPNERKRLEENAVLESMYSTNEQISKKYNIACSTVRNYIAYAKAIGVLSMIVPELTSKILSGDIEISRRKVIELSRLPSSDIKCLSEQILAMPSGTRNYALSKIFPKEDKAQMLNVPAGSVKDMPAYDPDAEILSLALTIPSWSSLIERTRSSARLMDVSDTARKKLKKELMGLMSVAYTMILSIKEKKQ